MKGFAPVVAAVIGALAASAAAGDQALRGALHGRVCTALPPGATAAPCAPHRLTFVLVRSGRRYVVRSGIDGTYRVAVPAGAYRVELPIHVGVRAPRIRPFLVRVRPGHDDRIDLYLDTRFAAQAVA